MDLRIGLPPVATYAPVQAAKVLSPQAEGQPGPVSAAAEEAGASGSGSSALQDSINRGKAEAKVREHAFGEACRTCKSRMYQDGSNDPGVSFKSPANIDPNVAASVVMGHEMEHVAHEKAKAESEGGRIISQTVILHTGICPECGRTYVAGGTTHTVSQSGDKQNFAAGTPAAEGPARGTLVDSEA